jgi:ubiquinone/menaquinone biosynthesis C-methylase UbiE
MERTERVKELFENTSLYLTYDYNLQIRQETVDTFTGNRKFKSTLDMPCGNGAISVPLIHKTEKLTLLDISENMIKLAESSISENNKSKVTLINGDFFEQKFKANSFDLVICLGLLAHVNSPKQLLDELSNIIEPGGMLIIQNTNSNHFYSHLIRVYLFLKNIIKKQPYTLNKVSASFLESTLANNGFELKQVYRYNQSFLGLSNFFSNTKKYKLTRWFFGTADSNKHAAWGSDYTYSFIKK